MTGSSIVITNSYWLQGFVFVKEGFANLPERYDVFFQHKPGQFALLLFDERLSLYFEAQKLLKETILAKATRIYEKSSWVALGEFRIHLSLQEMGLELTEARRGFQLPAPEENRIIGFDKTDTPIDLAFSRE